MILLTKISLCCRKEFLISLFFFGFLLFFSVWGDDDTFDPVSRRHMSDSSCPVTLTAHNPRGKGSWVLCQAQRGGRRKASQMHDVRFRMSLCASVPVCDFMCDSGLCVHVCQSEGMDACQRREQHHVRLLVDDPRFRYTNTNRQLSHETISSLPLCSMCVSKVWQGALVIC